MNKAHKKGQVEFIVIVALIIIAIVAVILASRQAIVPSPVTPGLPEEAKTVKDAVVNLINAGLKENLLLIYNQGGEIKPKPSVKFGFFDTRIWTGCGEVSIPDVSKEIGSAILAYLRGNLKDEMDFYGKHVIFDFSKARSEVDIIKDRITIRIYLPTKVEDYDVPQPYETNIQSKLYDILDFSKNFVNDVNSTRFFEIVTLTSMVHSNPESDKWVPLVGTQVGCGNILFKTRKDILPGIKGIMRYVASHVVWNTQPMKLAENPFYPINSVGGKFYPDLQVAFAYPPSWDEEIDKNFAFAPDPLRVVPKPIMPLLPFCMAPYTVLYNFRYPVIVMVEDSLLNQWFKFAVMVNIENSQPGNCSMKFGEESEYAKICVNEANCQAKIIVKDSSGNPIEGADADFYICNIGRSDNNGVIQGKIPCIVSELHVYKEGYRSFGDLFRSDELGEKEIVLKKIEESITLHLKGIEVEAKGDDKDGTKDDGKFETYQVKGSSTSLTPFVNKDMVVIMTLSPVSPNYFTGEDTALIILNYDENGNIISDINISGLQPISYYFTLTVAENETGIPLGYINNSVIDIGEGDKEFYIYTPLVLKVDGEDIKEPGVDPSEADQLTELITNICGAPIRKTEASC
ncbi:MAG: hypothetical protein QXO27_04110 [Candidatus Aenigmatarchaeota archaeon]